MALCTLALFVVSLGYGVVVPLLPQLSGQAPGAAGASALSIVYAVYAAAKIGAQVPGGAWVDAAGGRRVLRVGLVAFALSLAGFLVPGNVAWFALVRALEGAATGLVYPAVFALTLQSAPERSSGKRISAVVGVGSSGLLVGPALGGALVQFGPRLPVAIALGAALVLVAAALWSQLLPARTGASPSTAAPLSDGPRRTVASELRSLLALASVPAFLGLSLPIAFNKLTFSAFQGLLPLHGPAALGLDTRGVTVLFAITGIVFGLAQPVGGFLIDRFSARAVSLSLTPPLLLSLAAMAFVPGPISFGAAWASYVAASSIIFTATLKHAARAFGTEQTYGGVFGVLGTLTDLMTIVGPLLFLNLYPLQGAWVFLSMAAVGVPCALGYLALARGTLHAPVAAVRG